MKLSMTYDQGREMAKHCLRALRCIPPTQEVHGNEVAENTNGLIRCLPKGTDFNKVSRYEDKKVQDLLNGRPRLCLISKNLTRHLTN